MALLPDGHVLVADAERRLGVYAADGTLLAALELPVRVMSLRREDTRLVALANCLANAAPPLLIDLDRRRVVARLEGHVGWVLSARWTSGGRVLTAGADGTARLWDGSAGQLLQTYKGGPRSLADAALMSGVVVGGRSRRPAAVLRRGERRQAVDAPAHKSAVTGVHLEGDDIAGRRSRSHSTGSV